MKRSILAFVVLLACIPPAASAQAHEPWVVVALIDSGINPYSPAFRDERPVALQPPSTYLPGYPADCASVPEVPTTTCAVRLELTLPPIDPEADPRAAYRQAYEADKHLWEQVQRRQLYYVPGTSIVGALSFREGSVRCPSRIGHSLVGDVAEVTLPPPASIVAVRAACRERIILDDHGHGTMTASRATGSPSSLAPGARVVAIEGLGSGSSTWAAEQPWIDVQSNSWASLVPAPADLANMNAFADAAKKQFVVVASGNGLGFSGLAPTPTQLDGLGAPGVILVGAHDNGRVTAWHGQPAHVVADAYAGYMAIHDSLEQMRPDPVACCTSTSAPYAAGGAAAILREARRILGDTATGLRPSTEHGLIAAMGPPGLVTSGPLADGIFTMQEWKRVYSATAEARPAEGAHDGLVHWLGEPTAPRYAGSYLTADNPYCQFCWTLPVRWTELPGAPAYPTVGYGAINERSVALARDVLGGTAVLPARPDEDAFFAAEEQTRRLLFDPFTD